jgi:hypothetical protein
MRLNDTHKGREAFSKMKHVLRKIGARTKETLIEAMSGALVAVSAEDVRGFFVHHSNRTRVAATIKDAARRYLTMDSFQGVQKLGPQRSRRSLAIQGHCGLVGADAHVALSR